MSETDILQGGAAIEEASVTKTRRPLPERCYACAAPVKGPYCYACGQKNDDCRRSIVSLFGESVRDVASLEGRFLRTVRAVVTRPGRHLRDYSRGVRSPYSPPIRFFLVVSFLFFTTLWLTDRQIVAFQPEVEIGEDGKVDIKEWAGGFFVKAREVHYSAAERAAMVNAVQTDTATIEVREEVLRAAADAEIATIQERADADADAVRAEGGPDADDDIAEIRADAEADIADIRADLADDLADLADALRAEKAARDQGLEEAQEGMAAAADGMRRGLGDNPASDAIDRAAKELADREAEAAVQPPDFADLTVNGRSIDRDRFRDGLFRLAENPRLFNSALRDWIPRIMILMIPLMALLGAVFVRGKDALLYDHALLSLNTHAVAFGLMTLGMWTAGFLPGWLFGWAVFLGVPFYYARAMRGAFRRSRRKTIAATVFVFSVYGLVFSTALTSAAINAFAETL